MKTEFSYEEVPYPSYTFPQTSPDRMATIARLHGLLTAAPDNCRVLELGCGDGTNLLSFAYMLPESRFVGIDLSEIHIKDAVSATASLGLTNIEFRAMDVMEMDAACIGEFDYIIAHGLFSWVPAVVRNRILEIYGKALRPNGIGYISYNANPGCHVRRIIWDLLRFHAPAEMEPIKRVEAGRAIVGFVAEAMSSETPYKTIAEAEIATLLEKDVETVFHDDLAVINEPFYLTEFVSLIESSGLRYLADANPTFLGSGNLSADAATALEVIATDQVKREQYLDFVELTRFRSSLVCRAETSPDITNAAGAIAGLLIASQIRCVSDSPNVRDESVAKFEAPNGGSFEINHPLTKSVLVELNKSWPRSQRFSELIADESSGDDRERTLAFLWQLFVNGFIKLHVHQPEFAADVSEFPEASKFARWQIERGCSSVSTMAGVNISPEFDVVRSLIELLDGTRDLAKIAEEMALRIKIPFSERTAFHESLPVIIRDNLQKMAEWGLLIK